MENGSWLVVASKLQQLSSNYEREVKRTEERESMKDVIKNDSLVFALL